MKLARLKLANAIKVGQKEGFFFSDENYDLELKDVIIRITEKRSKISTCTSLYNCIYWNESDTKTSFSPVLSGAKEKKI